MQGDSGNGSVPRVPADVDKMKVLDIKPLRSVKPIFPPSNEAAPFVCTSPSGPFPSNFSSFYPVHVPPPPSPPPPPEPHPHRRQRVAAPTPLRSYRTPEPSIEEISNEDTTTPANGKRRTRFRALASLQSSDISNEDTTTPANGKRRTRFRDLASSQSSDNMVLRLGRSTPGSFVIPMSSFQQESGNTEMVDYVLMTFDGLRRKLSQLEDAKESPGSLIRRTDLKAANLLMTQGVRTNTKKRVGAVPGVEVGDIFFFRMEMCVVGLHSQTMGGIDSMKGDGAEELLAVSIVSSGYYDDDAEDTDVLIYTGQGGAMSKGKQASDQKLEKGNLALDRSMHSANEVRVIRGIPDPVNPIAKVYMYDGLYIIQQSWMEKGKSGANTFKYKLVRVPGQPEAYAVWKSMLRWKEDISARPGLILPDLASGAESISVPLVNEVDGEKGPAYFSYISTLKYSKTFQLLHSSYECSCNIACKPSDHNCACVRRNEGGFPYTGNGLLVARRPLIYECGPTCPCGSNCKNRVSQGGLRVRLEVFKTKNKGWGLRSGEPIRAGTFICEYGGEVIDKDRLRRKEQNGDKDEYIFDTSRVYQSFKWNYEAGLLEDDSSDDSSEEYDLPSPLIISAKDFGNVARFMNHSCYPNVFWQPITYGSSNESYVHIGFFAMKHIPPMTELTYDYGVVSAEGGRGAALRKKKCLCGYSKCGDHFGV